LAHTRSCPDGVQHCGPDRGTILAVESAHFDPTAEAVGTQPPRRRAAERFDREADCGSTEGTDIRRRVHDGTAHIRHGFAGHQRSAGSYAGD
jgi:hypothetical protein